MNTAITKYPPIPKTVRVTVPKTKLNLKETNSMQNSRTLPHGKTTSTTTTTVLCSITNALY